jgi:hypothetical protein
MGKGESVRTKEDEAAEGRKREVGYITERGGRERRTRRTLSNSGTIFSDFFLLEIFDASATLKKALKSQREGGMGLATEVEREGGGVGMEERDKRSNLRKPLGFDSEDTMHVLLGRHDDLVVDAPPAEQSEEGKKKSARRVERRE